LDGEIDGSADGAPLFVVTLTVVPPNQWPQAKP
jgi:hypothetical protein